MNSKEITLNPSGYPPALARMIERRDRFAKNAARLDVWNIRSKRERAKLARWRRASARESTRITQHPFFDSFSALPRQ